MNSYTIQISASEEARLRELTGKRGGDAVVAVLNGVLRAPKPRKATPKTRGRGATRRRSYASPAGSKTYKNVRDLFREMKLPGYAED